MRAPLVVRSVVDSRRYLTAVIFFVLGAGVLVCAALGYFGLLPLILAASIFLVLWGPASAARRDQPQSRPLAKRS